MQFAVLVPILIALGLGPSWGAAEPPRSTSPTSTPASTTKGTQSPPTAASAQGIALTITGDVPPELAAIAGQLTTVFYQSYPLLLARFEHPDKPAPRHITLVFERGLKVPAHCRGGIVTVSVEWLQSHPQDVGLLTHELTHAVQAYPKPDPGWWTEGLADYARYRYGPREQPGWELPRKLSAQQSYRDSYRVTGRFLQWLETRSPEAIDQLHRRMQTGEFTLADFEKVTGKTIDDLWAECVTALSQTP